MAYLLKPGVRMQVFHAERSSKSVQPKQRVRAWLCHLRLNRPALRAVWRWRRGGMGSAPVVEDLGDLEGEAVKRGRVGGYK